MTNVLVQVRTPEQTRDIALELSSADVSVGEVLGALGLPEQTQVDGQLVVEPASVRALDVLVPGSQLVAPSAIRPSGEDLVDDAVIDVAVVAGPDAARQTTIARGEYRLDGRWLLQVGEPASPADPGSPRVHQGQVEAVMVDGAAVAFSPRIADEQLRTRVVHRPPRRGGAAEVEPIHRLEAPAEIRPASPLSWATFLAPIPIAVMMAVFFRPIFAIFAAMGPVMALGRWIEARRRFRRDVAQRDAAVGAMVASLDQRLRAQAEALAQARWQSHPHVAELWRRARDRSVRLWERRPGAPNFLEFIVSVGPDLVTPLATGAAPHPDVHQRLAQPLGIRPVPHVVDMDANTGVGVYGERNRAVAVARAAILQLVTLHGPADLKVGIVCEQSAAEEWDWLKWLPHVDGTLTATSCGPIAKRLADQAVTRPPSSLRLGESVGPVSLIVVDDPEADVASIQRAALDAGSQVRFLAVAPRLTGLPAACSTQVAAHNDVHLPGASAEIVAEQAAGAISRVSAVGVSGATAASWARSLSAMVDPEVTGQANNVEAGVSLSHLLQVRSYDDVARRWAERPVGATAVVPIGVSDDGPFTISLSEDGPHALVAGTTGSGKSELLRTLVLGLAVDCPPELLNLVLIDFKGGGAFDAVAQLPHVAGLITDLDETMVARAIASLRAELHRRETLFRELGVTSFDEAQRCSEHPLARLVVVIDEFATLATEYGELMSAIVDLAARGRSLGMHLVLATQRPSGVVDQKIRANTNLRVALRVQDALDSQDIVGTAAAAGIDRRAPGRAIVSIGGDAPATVQTSYSGALDTSNDRCTARPHGLFPSAQHGVAGEADAPHMPTELQVLVDAITAVSSSRGVAAPALWREPLPSRLDWIDLAAHELSADFESAGVALGLEDLPESQAQPPWRWNPDAGPLAVYAASATCTGKVLVAAAAALAARHGHDPCHLYVVDGDAGGVTPLRSLPNTGAYVALGESDRLERTMRFFEAQLAARRSGYVGAAEPRLLLMVDNMAAVMATMPDVQAADFVDRLSAIARDGTPQRIHVVVAARTVRDIGHRLSQQFPNRLVLALADMGGYLTLGLKTREVPMLPEMRAIDLSTRRLVQLVEPPDLTSRTDDVSPPCQPAPQPIHEFPETFCASELAPASVVDDVLRIPLGIEAERLDHVALELRAGEHALVVASNGMGRSELVRLVAYQLSAIEPAIEVIAVDQQTACLDNERLASAPGWVVIVIDDADRLGADTVASLEAVLDAGHRHIRIIAATTPMHARSVRSWVARIRASGIGAIVGGSSADGDLFGVRLGTIAGLGRLPGRGHVIGRGHTFATQFGLIPTVPADPNAPVVNL